VIVQEFVEVIVNNVNYQHYKSLGYSVEEYPKRNTLVQVKTSDLPEYSHTKIDCSCAICGKVKLVAKAKLTRSLKSKGQYECESCGRTKPRLNQAQAEMEFNLRGLTLLSEYQNNKQRLTFVCKEHPEFGEQVIALGDLKKGGGCKACNRDTSWLYKLKPDADLGTYHFLRRAITPWRDTHKALFNHICLLSKKRSTKNHIHHFEDSFKEIMDSFFASGKFLDYRPSASDYSEQELGELRASFYAYHNEHAIGICVSPEIHQSFHSRYGKQENAEGFIDFWKANRKEPDECPNQTSKTGH